MTENILTAEEKNKLKEDTKKGKRGGFGNFKIFPDRHLGIIFGSEDPITPSQAMKKYWIYIKKYNLAKKV